MGNLALMRLNSGIGGVPYSSGHHRQSWIDAIDEAVEVLGRKATPQLREVMKSHIDTLVGTKAYEALIKIGSRVEALRGLYPSLSNNISYGSFGYHERKKIMEDENRVQSLYQSNEEEIRRALLIDCSNPEYSRKAVFVMNMLNIEKEVCSTQILNRLTSDPEIGIKMYQDALIFPHLMKNERLKEAHKIVQGYVENKRTEESLRNIAIECMQKSFSPQPNKAIKLPQSVGGLEAITSVLNSPMERPRPGAITSVLNSPMERLKTEAIEALGTYRWNSKSAKVSEILANILKSNMDERLKRPAAKSLGNFGKQGIEQLLDLYKGGSQFALEALYLHSNNQVCYPGGPVHEREKTGERFDEQSGHTLYHIHCSNCNRKLDHWNDE